MRKIIAYLLLMCMMLTAFTACGGSDTPSNDGQSDTPSENKFTPETIPAENIDPRQVALDYMYKMANIEWTPSEDINLAEIQKNLYYKKGTTYHGIIYITGNRTMTDYDEFMAQLNDAGEYIGPTTRMEGWGNHCSSAIRLAYDQVSKDVEFTWTGAMVPSKNKGTLPVGDYIFDETDTTTDTIIAKNKAAEMYECYAQLQKGDSILTCWGPTGHARMVVDVHVEKSAAGKINPGRSYVKCIEQTNSFDSQRKDGVNTTWYVEHLYMFNALYEAKYIPLTIAVFSEEAKDTEFTVKSINTASNITEGTLKGIVRSSYANIKSVTVEFVDSDNNVVATETYQNTSNDPLVFQFSNAKAPEGITSLAAGDYTYYITANTLFGSAKVHALEFTIE